MMLAHERISGRTAGQISASIERAIREGDLLPGAQVPPIRGLATSLGVSPMTVASAFRELNRRGLLVAAGRRGTRVAPEPPLPVRTRIYVPSGARDLASGNPDPFLLPPLADALSRVDVSPARQLEEGKLADLIEIAAAQFAADAIAVPSLAVVAGALDGIERVLQAHLRPGDTVAVEDPGFVRAYDLLRPLGLYLEPVGLDEFGPKPEAVQRAVERGARALILTPRAQNPTGAALDEGRAGELRTVLERHADVLVVEDDHAAGVAGARAYTVSTPDRPNWAIVRSVAKSLSPDLRLAVLAGDATTVGRVEGRQLIGMGWVSRLVQRLVVEMWSDPGSRDLLERAERAYLERRTGLIDALARRGIEARGRSGFNIYLTVDDEAAVAGRLLEQGWAVTGLERWRIESPPAIRITVATLSTEEGERLADDVASSLRPSVGGYSA